MYENLLFMVEIMVSRVVEGSSCNVNVKYALSGSNCSITRSTQAFNDNQRVIEDFVNLSLKKLLKRFQISFPQKTSAKMGT